jgi:hypothetical protein
VERSCSILHIDVISQQFRRTSGKPADITVR